MHQRHKVLKISFSILNCSELSIKLLMDKLGWDPSGSTCKFLLDPWLWLREVLILMYPLVLLGNNTWALLQPVNQPLWRGFHPFSPCSPGAKHWLFLCTGLVRAKIWLICYSCILKEFRTLICYWAWFLVILYMIFNEREVSVKKYLRN